MHEPVQVYQVFIDGLLEWPFRSVKGTWVREWDLANAKTYEVPDEFNRQMEMFTPEQRQIVAQMLQEAHEAAIFQVLSYLEPYTLSRNGIDLPREPFGYTRYEDWIHRCRGGTWAELANENDQ